MITVFDDLLDNKLVASIRDGGVGVLPTDTVYGLVCDASNPAAVAKLYALKKRENKPGTIIAADIEQLIKLGLKRRYLTAVIQYWPGAVSVIIPSSDPSNNYLRTNVDSLAVRVVSDEQVIRLLKQTGALLTSSANQPGEKPAENIAEAQEYFNGAVDFYVDGGTISQKAPSTLIRIVDDAVEVIRQGAVKIIEQKQ